MGRTKELFQEMQERFISQCEAVEQGEMLILDAVISFREQKKECDQLLEYIKSFEEKNAEKIESEVNAYQGVYKGKKIEIKQGGRMFSYKNIKEWQKANEKLKEIEEKYKQAFISREKGLLPVDENGELLELPEINYKKNTLFVR